jgi:hypothetical protein
MSGDWKPEPADWPRLRREPSETDAHVRDLLPAYVNDTLEPGEYGRVVAHLRRCAGCQAGLKSWEVIAQTIRATVATNAPAPDRLFQRVVLALDQPPAWEDFAEPPLPFARPDPVPPPVTLVAATNTNPTATTAHARPRVSTRRRPIMAELSVATVLVLVVAALLAAYRLRQATERGTIPGAAVTVTAPASPTESTGVVRTLGPDEAVDISECTTQPRPPGTVLNLVETPTEITPIFPPFSADERAALVDLDDLLADRPAADPAMTVRIADTLRQLTACRYYAGEYDERGHNGLDDYDGRYWALFSADFFRHELGGNREPGTDVRIPALWLPIDPRPRAIDTTWTLPDGRVAAKVVYPSGNSPGQALFIVVLEGDRWLVDEIGPLEPDPVRVPEGPADPTDYSEVQQMVLFDDRAFSQVPSTASAFRVGQEVFLAVANLGSLPQRFEIPEFGFSLDVAAGHSVTLLIDAPSGRYELASYVAAAGSERRILDAEIVFVDEGTPIQHG